MDASPEEDLSGWAGGGRLQRSGERGVRRSVGQMHEAPGSLLGWWVVYVEALAA